MRLFIYDEENLEVVLDKAWVAMVPEFQALIKRDKGSSGDYDGRKKAHARKEFVYVYFMVDFASPIRDWDEKERHLEALRYAGLPSVDDAVQAACKQYERMQLEASSTLRTFRALQSTKRAMDTYLETLNMAQVDRKGELLNDPLMIVNMIDKLDRMHTSIERFEKRVIEELKQSKGIRGKNILSEAEQKIQKYSEEDVMTGSEAAQGGVSIEGTGNYADLKVIFDSDTINPLTTADGIPQPG